MSGSIFPYMLVRSAGLPPLSLSIDWPDKAAQMNAGTEAVQELQQAFDVVLTTLPDSTLRTAVYNARKRFFQKKPVQHGFAAILEQHSNQGLIAQLLTCLLNWEGITAWESIARELLETGLAQNWMTIQEAAKQPDFQKALLFASHDLLNRLPAFCSQAPEHFTAKDRQTGLALLQYLTRAAYKTSPLSRFTTVSLWRWQQAPTPPDADQPDFLQSGKAVVTPNVAILPALYEVLLAEPAFYQSLSLVLNPCITNSSNPNGWQWLYFDGEQESFQQMAANPAVEAVIEICLMPERLVSWRVLLSDLQKKISAEENELANLIHELVALGLLAWQLPERGLTPGWCGSLYNYLGHLPIKPVISEAAALLQWLRTAARTLPFQSLTDAQATQRQTVQQVQSFFEGHGSPMPPIPAEQVFFEDVERGSAVTLPPDVIQQLMGQLADCWRQSGPPSAASFRSALQAYAASELAIGETQPFLDFCQKFLARKADWEKQPPAVIPPFPGKIGALMQVFKTEEGSYSAVINGLFPGGGKLMVRWLHLFPTELRERLQDWFPTGAMAFPWQGWSNVNFQPALAVTSLSVPDGRVGGLDGAARLLGNLEVKRTAEGPVLMDRLSGRRIWFTDLGLESPATRPPAMQVLWHLGLPMVSLENLWPAQPAWENQGAGWSYLPREVFQALVLRRATWRIGAETWRTWLPVKGTPAERMLHLRQALQDMLPTQFFVRFHGHKPQYMNLDSPVCLLLLEKMLRSGQGDLWCVEMLPEVEQGNLERVGELVVEFDTAG